MDRVITTKFNVGDTVYAISIGKSKTESAECSFCNGSKTVVGADKSSLHCPKCLGSGVFTPPYKYMYKVDKIPHNIVRIKIDIDDGGLDTYYYLHWDDDEGYGEGDLFSALEEAEKFSEDKGFW